MKKRILSLILALSIVLTACPIYLASAQEKTAEPQNFEEYAEFLEKESRETAKSVMLSKKRITDIERFNFVTDDMVGEICDYIKAESDLDLIYLISGLPSTNGALELVYGTFNINASEISEICYEIRNEMDEKGKDYQAALFHFFAVYFGIIEECKAYCVPAEEENVYEIHLAVTTKDGSVDVVGTGVMVNAETGLAYGKDGNGILGTGYSFSIPDVLLYSQINMWTRDFGFMLFYDIFSYTTPFFLYETRRIKFDYDGLEWMIQIWKGNYLISNGAEVGIYTRDARRFGTYYDCATDEQMMKMSLDLYHGDELIFSRPRELHWWITGFRITYDVYPADSMTMKFSIEMKDEEMLSAFCNAIKNHYKKDMTYTVDGLTVNVVW